MASLVDTLAGHYWTIAPALRHRARPVSGPAAEPWSLELEDPKVGRVRLRGLLRERADASAAVVVVHGLGGTTGTHYCVAAANAAEAAGVSCLRVALRGADRDGEDLYHGGQAEDLHAVLGSTALARYTRLYVLGFSLGGHITLRYALDGALHDPRVRAVAAVCAPLDLELGAQHIDSPSAYVYRRHVLTGLKAMYEALARRRAVATPLSRVLAVRTIRQWDELTVVPRYGFSSVARYYQEMSVGPQLHRLALPALLVQHPLDPMVPAWTYRGHLARPLPKLELRALPAGGHVGYPPGVDLGEPGPLGVEAQALSWLLSR
jgi:predicted alpha/beta-fold hydrolase